MTFTTKDWKNQDVTTPWSAEAAEDLEARLAGYTDAEVAAEAALRAAGDSAAADALAAEITARQGAVSTLTTALGTKANSSSVTTSLAGKADLVAGHVPVAQLASGTADGTKFVADDGTLKTPSGGASGVVLPWAPSTAYKAGQAVTQGGLTYLANVDFTSGTTFSASNWTVLPGVSVPASFASYVRASGVYGAETLSFATSSDGVVTGANYRKSHSYPLDLESFRVKYANWGEISTLEADGYNDITVRAAVEYPAGTYTPLFFRGSRDIVIQAGGTVECDTTALHIPAGTQFWTRTLVTVASGGMKWNGTRLPNTTLGEATSSSAAETDKTTSGTITNAGVVAVSPVQIVSDYVPAKQAVVLAGGDSIMSGATASSATGGSVDSGGGFIWRALSATLPMQRMSIFGERADFHVVAANSRRRWALATGCNILVDNTGINDLANSRTVAQLQAALLTKWGWAQKRGMKVWQCTLMPYSTSSDSFATTANQTANATAAANRVTYNNWLRDGAPIDATSKAAVAAGTSSNVLRAGATGHPLAGYFETADTVESSRDSGLWKVDGTANKYTSDGLHPTTAGHTLAAAAVLPASLTI